MKSEQRDYIVATLFRFSIIIIISAIKEWIGLSDITLGIIILITCIYSIIKLVNKRMLITPLIIGELLLTCFGLYELHFVHTMTYMKTITIVVVEFSIFIWNIICSFNSKIFKDKEGNLGEISWDKGNENFKYVIIFSFVICAFINLMEWKIAGGIPILRNDMETFRFKVVFNSTLHVIAMCMKYIPFFIAIYCKFDFAYLIKKQKLVFIILLLSIVFLIATAFRGELMASLCLTAFTFFIYKKPKMKNLIKVGIVFAIIMAIYPIARSYVQYGNRYISDMKKISTYPNIWFCTPLYQTFAANYHYFNKDVSTFPELAEFGHGQYVLFSEIPFIDSYETLAETQNRVWNNGFYAELTSTIFGPWYADFGYIGCFISMILLSLLTNFFYNYYIDKNDIRSLTIYVFIFYKGFQMMYDNTYSFVSFLYLLYLWISLSVKFFPNKHVIGYVNKERNKIRET